MNGTQIFARIFRATALLAVVASALATSRAVVAQDGGAALKWTPVFKGIDLADYVVEEPLQRVVVARIDRDAPGVKFKTTTPHPDFKPDERETRRETAPEFVERNGVAIAINGSFYKPFGGPTITQTGDANLRGLAVCDGFVESRPEKNFPTFAIMKDGTMTIRQFELDENLDEIELALSGPAISLKNGEIPEQTEEVRHPRTGVGYSQDQRYVYFMTIDGRRPGYSEGATRAELGVEMRKVGAWDALCLDGGGSTTMAARDADGSPIVLNWPCNRRISPDGLRYNGNSLGATAEGDALQPFAEAIEIKHTDFVKWTPIYNGVSIASWREDSPQRAIFAARVELAVEGIEVRTTAPNKKFEPETRETWRQSTAQFLFDNDLVLAINANFYSPFGAQTIGTEGDSNVLGLAVSDGFVESQPQPGYPSFIMTKDGGMEIRQVEADEKLDGIQLAVSGNKIVVKDGEVAEQTDKARHPRTGIGFSYDKRFLYFVAIDGRQRGYSDGATYEEIGEALRFCGAYQGLNLDGGGSTTMVVAGEDGVPTVLNSPVNGTPDKLRRNGNSIGVKAYGSLQNAVKDGRR